jgi:hypothetical protein
MKRSRFSVRTDHRDFEVWQIQSELHRSAAFPFLSHGLSPSEDEIVRPVPDTGRAASEPRQAYSDRKCRPVLSQHACAVALIKHPVREFAAMATQLLPTNDPSRKPPVKLSITHNFDHSG